MRWHLVFVRRFLAVACALAATAATAHGAVAYYVLIPEIHGESTAPGRTDWIDAAGFGASVLETTKGPNLPPVLISKPVDKASPLLTQAVSRGDRFDQVTLEMVNASTGRLIYHLVLRDVLVSSVKQESAGTGTIVESVMLDYAQVEWSYTPVAGNVVVTHFDKAENQGGIGPLPNASPTPTPPLDSDGDGIPDIYENANGLNPALNDANGDLDGDGAANLDEFRAGTRANNPLSVFRVRGVTLANGTSFITWSSVAGKTYQVLGSSFPEGPFTIVKQNISSAGDGETSTTVAGAGASLFYKVQTQ